MTFANPVIPPTVEVWIVRGRSWWGARQPRERLLITGLLVLPILAVVITGIWTPIRDARRTAHQDIQVYGDLATRLRAAGPGLRTPSTAIRGGSVQTVVTTTAAEASLPIRQIEQTGAVTTVAMDGADFGVLISWLDRLQREQGISVSKAEIERQTAPGVVNARLSLVRP